MILGGVAAGVVLVAAVAFGLSRGGGEAQAVAAASTATAQGDVTSWFDSTAEVWGEVTTAATGVRTFIETNDGLALQPACTTLGKQAAAAEAHPPAPDPALQALWIGGAKSFSDAATWCAKLWDGTAMAPSAILAEVTNALDRAEASWEELARRVGRPLPTPPSGTMGTLDGQPASRAPAATSTPAAPATSPPPAASTPTGAPRTTQPPFTLPTFGTPSSNTPAPNGSTTPPTG
jgi:hypothetical protein